MFLDQEVHVVILAVPVAIVNGTAVKSDYVALKNYSCVEFIIPFGHVTGDDGVLYVYEAQDASGTNATKRAFKYRMTSAVLTDSVGAVTAGVAASGATVATTNTTKTWIIDVDNSELTDTYPFLCVEYDGGASTSDVDWAVIAILKPRFPQTTNISAVA